VLNQEGADALLFQQTGYPVDGRAIGEAYHLARRNVAKVGDLLLDRVVDGTLGAANDEVGAEAEAAALADAHLGGLRLRFAGGLWLLKKKGEEGKHGRIKYVD
jgi:hypothetical protein